MGGAQRYVIGPCGIGAVVPEGWSIGIVGMRRIDIRIANEIVGQQRRVVIDDDTVHEQSTPLPGFRAAGGHEDEHHGLVGRHIEEGLPCCATRQKRFDTAS